VVTVGGDSSAGDLSVDACATGLRVLGCFEDENACALAENEAVPLGVPGTRRCGWVVVPLAQRPHRGERGEWQGVDARLGAADDNDVCATTANHLQTLGYRLRTRCTCRDRGVNAGTGLQL